MVSGFAVMAQKSPAVSGYVKTEAGEALPGATVSLVKTASGTSTDTGGSFTLTAPKPGTYTIQVSLMGYQAFSQNIQIQPGKPLALAIQLKENQQNLREVSVFGKTET